MSKIAVTRRELMIATGGLGFAGAMGALQKSNADDSDSSMSTESVLAKLKSGNRRFADGKPRHLHSGRAWREGLLSVQKPFAVILGCADSRVPTEMVFDQGFGDLFVIRNAGNIVMEDVAGSIEYAAVHLHTRLVVVMGHDECGAVPDSVVTMNGPIGPRRVAPQSHSENGLDCTPEDTV